MPLAEKRAEPTPGPWIFEELCAVNDGDGYVLLTEGSRVEICHHGGAYSMGLPREEVLANARLIAAAPDTAAERDRLKAANVELAKTLEGLSSELAGWLTTADAGLPAVIKTLGDCADLHMAHRKALAALKAHGPAEDSTP